MFLGTFKIFERKKIAKLQYILSDWAKKGIFLRKKKLR